MKTVDTQPKAHLFICCRQREGKPSCGAKGSETMVVELKKWVKNEGLRSKVKVSQSSCLGHCESGIAACIYPENRWLDSIDVNDTESLKKLLQEYADL